MKELIFGLEILIIFLPNYFFKSLRLTFNNDIWGLYNYNQAYLALLSVVYLLGTLVLVFVIYLFWMV